MPQTIGLVKLARVCIVSAFSLHCVCIVSALCLHCVCIVSALCLHCVCIVSAVYLYVNSSIPLCVFDVSDQCWCQLTPFHTSQMGRGLERDLRPFG